MRTRERALRRHPGVGARLGAVPSAREGSAVVATPRPGHVARLSRSMRVGTRRDSVDEPGPHSCAPRPAEIPGREPTGFLRSEPRERPSILPHHTVPPISSAGSPSRPSRSSPPRRFTLFAPDVSRGARHMCGTAGSRGGQYRSGTPWTDLPEHFGSWKGAHNRLRKWAADGTWAKLFTALLARRQCT
ncbi:transposase [Streptomyces sp. NPDC048489]|uniref:transposase n=1 Tax=Streptomyces sp. NPDC048489 TaxID=3154504 RepID=UPI00341983CD